MPAGRPRCKGQAATQQPRHPGCAGTCGAGTAGASLSLPSGATVKQRWPWLSLYRAQLPSAETSQGEGGAGCSSAVAHSCGTTACKAAAATVEQKSGLLAV